MACAARGQSTRTSGQPQARLPRFPDEPGSTTEWPRALRRRRLLFRRGSVRGGSCGAQECLGFLLKQFQRQAGVPGRWGFLVGEFGLRQLVCFLERRAGLLVVAQPVLGYGQKIPRLLASAARVSWGVRSDQLLLQPARFSKLARAEQQSRQCSLVRDRRDNLQVLARNRGGDSWSTSRISRPRSASSNAGRSARSS